VKPVYQTRYGKNHGNCFQAALASLFEEELESVPDFCNIYSIETNEWYEEFIKWLNKKGLGCITIKADKTTLKNIIGLQGAFILVTGKNNAGVNHCVIYKDGVPVYNPNKSCKGIIPETAGIITPLNPGTTK